VSRATVDGEGEVCIVDGSQNRKESLRPEGPVVPFVPNVADEWKSQKEVADEVAEDRSFGWIKVLVVGAAERD
jgi:hypothetical protein